MILYFVCAVYCVDFCCALLCAMEGLFCRRYAGPFAQWVVHQWRLYERSLCSLLELQARKGGSYGVCCSPRYVIAPEYSHLLPLPLPLTTRASPPPAHL